MVTLKTVGNFGEAKGGETRVPTGTDHSLNSTHRSTRPSSWKTRANTRMRTFETVLQVVDRQTEREQAGVLDVPGLSGVQCRCR